MMERLSYRCPGGVATSSTFMIFAPTASSTRACRTRGKANTQRIERKHLTLRTRIKRLTRRTICFSKSVPMHDIVIGLFVNRYDFGLRV
jgi:IS1 family transposase